MSHLQTEAQSEIANGLDARGDRDILAELLKGQMSALAAVGAAQAQVSAAADVMTQAVAAGARLIYAASGSSGLMALADACELGGTFGIPEHQILVLMSGGLPVDARMPGNTEDDAQAAIIDAKDIDPADVVIAVTASGSTPYAVQIAQIAQSRGAQVVAIANNPDAAIFAHADVAVCAPTPPEVISGSTRLGAGTAQKAVLNMMSTLMGIRLGHVYDGMMVNLVADNDKLRRRAVMMVMKIVGVSEAAAQACLARAGGAVKPAVLLAAGQSVEQAQALLTETNGNLRACFARL